jgi:hypothetical protein
LKTRKDPDVHPKIRFTECRDCRHADEYAPACRNCQDADHYETPAPAAPPPAPVYGVNHDPSYDDVIALARAARRAIAAMPHGEPAIAALAYALENVDQWLDNNNQDPRV